MKYIAYGSNMSREQMAYRCPEARLLGTGQLYGYTLEFRGCVRGNAHATVDKSESSEIYVPVAVWEISARDETRLDLYEGFPAYYRKEEAEARLDDGTVCRGMLYAMNGGRAGVPAPSYYNGIRRAYWDLGLADEEARTLVPALRRATRGKVRNRGGEVR